MTHKELYKLSTEACGKALSLLCREVRRRAAAEQKLKFLTKEFVKLRQETEEKMEQEAVIKLFDGKM